MINDCLAIIMAGGESRRMGRDKATLPIGEHTMLQRVVGNMQNVFSQVTVSVRRPRARLSLPQVFDGYADAGPLAGLCAGLESAVRTNIPWVFAVATDMPFVEAPVIEYLAQQRSGCQAVVPVVNGHPQPLAAFYAASCLDQVQAMLRGNGKRSLRAMIACLNVRYIDETELIDSDVGLRSFIDFDTPQDLARHGI